MNTIEESKEYLRRHVRDPNGCTCPCCGQKVKMYSRKMNGVIARALVEFYKAHEGGFDWLQPLRDLDFLRSTGGSGDYAKARFWGLIENHMVYENGKHTSTGEWRLTEKGKEFVEGKVRVPKYAYVYNNKCTGLSDSDSVSVIEALGEKFDKSQIMGMIPKKFLQSSLF